MDSYEDILDRLCNDIIEVSEQLAFLEKSVENIRFFSENNFEE